MKLFLLLAACLSTVAISQAQTTPATSPSASTPAVSGTKNVGSDRADAPKAPGMSSSVPSRKAPVRARKGSNRRSSTTPPKASAAPAPAQ